MRKGQMRMAMLQCATTRLNVRAMRMRCKDRRQICRVLGVVEGDGKGERLITVVRLRFLHDD